MQLEYSIYQKRNKHRRRRNLIRRLFLVLTTIVVLFALCKIYSLQYRKNIEVNVLNNSLVDLNYLNNEINKYIEGKNFFLLSTRNLSDKIINSCNLLSDAVARKYIFPKYQIILFTVEKSIWAKVILLDMLQTFGYVTDEGDIVDPLQLKIDLLPKQLTTLYLNNKKQLNSDGYQAVEKVANEIQNKYNLKVEKMIINNDSELSIICDGMADWAKELKINAGKIDNELTKRISMLGQAFEVLSEREESLKGHLVEYIDLNLDNSIVFKELKNIDKPDLEKSKNKGFFKRKKY